MVKDLASFRADGATQLGLQGHFQHANAALAIALCQEWDQQHAATPSDSGRAARDRVASLEGAALPALYQAGLRSCQFAGRAQTISMCRDQVPGVVDLSSEEPPASSDQTDITFFMDGAHTPESMAACARCVYHFAV